MSMHAALPFTLFLCLLAVAGGLFVIGLSLIGLRLVWAYLMGWARRGD